MEDVASLNVVNLLLFFLFCDVVVLICIFFFVYCRYLYVFFFNTASPVQLDYYFSIKQSMMMVCKINGNDCNAAYNGQTKN